MARAMVTAGSYPDRAERPSPRHGDGRAVAGNSRPRAHVTRRVVAGGPRSRRAGRGVSAGRRAGKANLGMEKGGAEATYKGYTGG